MAQRIAGVAKFTANGRPLELRGNFTVSPTRFERSSLVGQDRFHGYSEMPRAKFIEGDISLGRDTSIEELDSLVDITVVAELANGWNYVLHEAFTAAARELNTREGLTRIRFEGGDMDEYQSG